MDTLLIFLMCDDSKYNTKWNRMWPHHFPNCVCPRPLAVYRYCVCVCRSSLTRTRNSSETKTRNNIQRCSKKKVRPAQTWLISYFVHVQPIRVSMERLRILYDVSFVFWLYLCTGSSRSQLATTTTRRKTPLSPKNTKQAVRVLLPYYGCTNQTATIPKNIYSRHTVDHRHSILQCREAS